MYYMYFSVVLNDGLYGIAGPARHGEANFLPSIFYPLSLNRVAVTTWSAMRDQSLIFEVPIVYSHEKWPNLHHKVHGDIIKEFSEQSVSFC